MSEPETAMAPTSTLTLREAADAYGLSLAWLRRLIREGQIESGRNGRRRIVARAELERYLATQRG